MVMHPIRNVALLLLFSLAASTGFGDCPKQIQFARKFLKAEFNGGRLKAHDKIFAMTTDAEDSVWTTTWVSHHFDIISCETVGSEAILKANYEVVGSISSSTSGVPVFSPETKTEAVEYHIIKVSGHWRVTDIGQLRPHVSVSAAVDSVNDTAQRNSLDPAYSKGTEKAIAAIKASISTDRLPASEE